MCKAWFELPYEERLEIASFIFEQITEYPTCSFRKLIYGRLGFSHDAYVPLYDAGGMTITNALVDADPHHTLSSIESEVPPATDRKIVPIDAARPYHN